MKYSHARVKLISAVFFVSFGCVLSQGSAQEKKTKPSQAKQATKESSPNIAFVKYDKAPEPAGGFAAIQQHLIYPEIAKKAGIEGRVVVNVLVDKSGQVDSVIVLKSLGDNGCDEAAIKAVKAVQWRPAQSKGEPVSVWVGIPVVFKLGQDKATDHRQTSGSKSRVEVTLSGDDSLTVQMKFKNIERSTDSLFQAYDKAPEPVGGFAAIQQHLTYPEVAKQAGIEGRVIVNVLVKTDGTVAETKILKSLGDNGCDEAAIKAVKSVQWQPARQDGRPVVVWVGIPVVFKLND